MPSKPQSDNYASLSIEFAPSTIGRVERELVIAISPRLQSTPQ